MNETRGRSVWIAVPSAIILLILLYSMFHLPLRPLAWGGPREYGPFEDGRFPAAGRWSREIRFELERLALGRTPGQPLEAMAEVLTGYHALLIGGRFLVLWCCLWRMSRRPWLATLVTTACAVPVLLGSPRHTDIDVGLFLFSILLACSWRKVAPSWGVLIALPVLFAVWVNAHDSSVVGLVWLGVLLVGRAIEWWQAPGDDSRSGVFRWGLALILCAAAVCLNPDGPRAYLDAFAITRNGSVTSQPSWQPIDFSTNIGKPWIYFGTLAILLLTQLWSSQPFRPTSLLVILVFGIWPLVQMRGMDYWWLVFAWLAVPEWTAILDGRNSITEKATPGAPRRWAWPALALATIVVLLATPCGRWAVTGRPRSLEAIVTPETPTLLARELTGIEALSELREAVGAKYPAGCYRGAILCGEGAGNFLAWVLHGRDNMPVLIYQRPETINQEHWEECRRVLSGHSEWWEIASRQQVNLIAIDPLESPALAERLRRTREWRRVQDDRLLVVVRREPRLPVALMKP